MQAEQSTQGFALGIAEPCAASRPGSARNQALRLEYAYRFANGRAAHSQRQREVAFGWQLVAVVQLAGKQLLLHVGEHHLMGLSMGGTGHAHSLSHSVGPGGPRAISG